MFMLRWNLISGQAYKSAAVSICKNGLPLQVVNTDAQGRLIFADRLIATSEATAELLPNANQLLLILLTA